MKKDIHPKYYPEAKVTCACGNVFTVGSTVESINVEICSACHPFYTGKQKLVDSARRVDKFEKRVAKKAEIQGARKGKKIKKEKQKTIKTAKRVKIAAE
ncbi:MAG: 50S ribosomal protein L31 [Patescibacteria group bacterium]